METNSKKKFCYINLIHYPLKSLGVGIRIGIWFEGCSIRCEGCISKHTWRKKKESKITLFDLIQKIREYNCKKITISGGEPFDQPEALRELLKFLKLESYEILLYSGYRYIYLKKKYQDILENIDVLIDGEFDKNLESKESFRGSSNQQIYIFNNKIKKKYLKFAKNSDRKLQIVEKNDKIYLLGIPKIGDMKKLGIENESSFNTTKIS